MLVRRLPHGFQVAAAAAIYSGHQVAFSGNKPGIQREASVAGKARRSGARVLSDVTTP